MKTYKVRSNFNPILWNRLDGLYVSASSGWTKVPDDTQISQIIWVNAPKPVKVEKPKTWNVKSESSKNVYVVTKIGKTITCTCPGYTFRRFCKHTLKMKKAH